jgi:hypothetical protein
MHSMQGYGGYQGYQGYRGYGAIDTSTTAGSQAATAYRYLQTGDAVTAASYINVLGPADRQTACTLMTAQAATDGGNMPAAVAALCAQAGVSASGMSTTTYILLGLGAVGIIYLLTRGKAKAAA